jgi:hypothetical protein
MVFENLAGQAMLTAVLMDWHERNAPPNQRSGLVHVWPVTVQVQINAVLMVATNASWMYLTGLNK